MKHLSKLSVMVLTLVMVLSPLSVHGETYVYTTATGSRYHATANCRGLSRARKVYRETLSAAKAKGLTACLICGGSISSSSTTKRKKTYKTKTKTNYSVSSQYKAAPKTDKNAYKVIHSNKPYFTASQKKTRKSFEKYSKLDSLGRCGVAFVSASKATMPTTKRGSIGMVKPTGWHTIRYSIVGNGSAGYLYNRCHLIAYEISGENANRRNLITGTRYMNITGMLPFENRIANYIKATGNHVLYRVTPDFKGRNLLASGVKMEAYSLEDHGKGIQFCVYCYNKQPGIKINYATGASSAA